jgi:ABC-2 type transport system ATP-binding protein
MNTTSTNIADNTSSTADGDTVISVSNLQMQYGDSVVLQDVNFTARRGEVIVLLGPNGAGKTTTIEALEGFRATSGGDITVLGVSPMKGDEAWRARLGVVLQSWRDHSRWAVRELLDHLGQYYAPYSTAERQRPLKTDDLIALVGLEAHANKPLSALSGGQRRRMDVAIGLIGNPEILFLDEPTVGFDPKARRDFHDVIHRLADMDNTTILLTTHDLDEAEKLADRILILAGGRIVADGSADKLAREVAGQSEVRWTQNGKQNVHAASDATAFVRQLLSQHKTGITDLEVKRASLEDTYMTIVQQHEAKQQKKQKGASHEPAHQ